MLQLSVMSIWFKLLAGAAFATLRYFNFEYFQGQAAAPKQCLYSCQDRLTLGEE